VTAIQRETNQARSRAIHMCIRHVYQCMTAKLDVMPKTTEQKRIVRTGKCEAEQTCNKNCTRGIVLLKLTVEATAELLFGLVWFTELVFLLSSGRPILLRQAILCTNFVQIHRLSVHVSFNFPIFLFINNIIEHSYWWLTDLSFQVPYPLLPFSKALVFA